MACVVRRRWCAPLLAAAACFCLLGPPASAGTPPMAVGLRVGTTGIGLDYELALGRYFGVRVGYSGFDYSHSVSTSDVDYHGTFRLSMGSALADWYPMHGAFHVTAGIIANGTRLDVTGQPAAGGTYTINGNTYTSADIGSLTGRLKFGLAASPYVGLGWGNEVRTNHHVHVLFDIGAIYGGTPDVTLNGVCGPAAPTGSSACSMLQSDVQNERLKLQHDVTLVKWYPVIDLGVAYRF
jgi:hypothetical protein